MMPINDALKRADRSADNALSLSGDVCALQSLAAEVRRLRDVVGKAGMRRVERLESALKVIHTWASVDGALDAEHVINLARRALYGGL